MEPVDLSHYNLRNQFTALEIANLIAGDDPDSAPDLSVASPKARFIYGQIKDAYARACAALYEKLTTKHAEAEEGTFFGVSANPHMLPSQSLWGYLEESYGRDFKLDGDILFRHPFERQLFARPDVETWLSLSDYKDPCHFTRKEETAAEVRAELEMEIVRLKQENAALQENTGRPEEPLDPRARNTLLIIIAALCDHSGIDLKARGTASEIAKMTEILGAKVGQDAVRQVVLQISDAVERRKK